MKVLNYNTVVKFETKNHDVVEGYVTYHERINNTWHYYVNVDMEKFKDVELTLDDIIIVNEQVLNIDTIKDSDWVDESEI